MHDSVRLGLAVRSARFLFISEMVSGVYVVQMDEDRDARFLYPPTYTAIEDDE